MSDEDNFRIPQVDEKHPAFVVAMDEIVQAEARLGEISSANPQKAQDLMGFFLESWRLAADQENKLTDYRDAADRATKRAKAEAILDSNAALKARGHEKPSADLREAVMQVDPAYMKAQEVYAQIDAILSWVKTRSIELQSAWRSARSLVDNYRQPPTPLHGSGPAPSAFGDDRVPESRATDTDLPPEVARLVGKIQY